MSNYKDLIKANGPASTMNGDTNNCAVLALSAAFEIPYDEANDFALKNWRRVRRKGISVDALIKSLCQKELFGKKIIEKSNKNKYIYKTTGKVVECSFQLGNFAKKMNEGTYYVVVKNHATVVKNGVIMDNTIPGRIIKYVWEIK